MASYLIAYDLVKENKKFEDYQPLWDELKRLGAHRTQLSLWLLSANNTPKEVSDHLSKFVDPDDRIWVTELRVKGYHFINAIGGTNDWISKNPPRI